MNQDTPQPTVDNSLIQEKIEQPQIPPKTTPEIETKKEEETPEERNWRAIREQRKQDRAEKEAAKKLADQKAAEVEALKAAMEAAFSKSSPQVDQNPYHANPYSQQEESEDDRISKRVQQELDKREQIWIQQQQQREIQEYPQRLRQTYADFDSVANEENLDWLDHHYPEVTSALKKLPDGYDKWSDIYKAAKRFVPNALTAKKEAAKAEANFNKPKSISSPGMTQTKEGMGNARLSDDKKQANWERMQKSLRTLG